MRWDGGGVRLCARSASCLTSGSASQVGEGRRAPESGVAGKGLDQLLLRFYQDVGRTGTASSNPLSSIGTVGTCSWLARRKALGRNGLCPLVTDPSE